ncbi:hypothetical protein [Alysiella filiformis]|uniref:hypothetical protein n=1 Tax=Alysiella filiformis TaxID=194196 RepID=UPI0015CB9C08|nr:hypothetical protein [Alysiella filiformis]QMT30330.1 hypothetical protein H3L97_03215 [Alysiella filiformis]UBQ57420.1 hypothetical protein JF568_05460 [Alysiella filiformis DSM 16848]
MVMLLIRAKTPNKFISQSTKKESRKVYTQMDFQAAFLCSSCLKNQIGRGKSA